MHHLTSFVWPNTYDSGSIGSTQSPRVIDLLRTVRCFLLSTSRKNRDNIEALYIQVLDLVQRARV